MLMGRIKLKNILSFGPDEQALDLRPLNVLIGPNGSGKSNFMEAIGLLRAAPHDLPRPISDGGGVGDWIWKGEPEASAAHIEAVLYPSGAEALRHTLTFAEKGHRFELTGERIQAQHASPDDSSPHIYFERRGDHAILACKDGVQRQLRPTDLDPRQSILSQRRDPVFYPELARLGDMYARIRLYREWSFGRNTPPQLPQDAALPNDFLIEGNQNLGLVLNRLRREPETKEELRHALRELYEDIVDCDVIMEGGTVQVILQEGNVIVPAMRLSDSTIRYLCLLVILCHPTPPPLVCIDQPELGLHPDILPGLADLLREASERCQLIITTHSDVLLDALTETPESIVVCEKHEGQTTLERLTKDDLAHRLEEYRLGELWTSGELGGNRW